MPWSSSFVAIDCETTGFGPSARILEVAAVTFENGAPVHEFSVLCCPQDMDWEKSAEALAVNGLTREELLGKPCFEDIIADLMLELAHPVWVAHNYDFDATQIRQEFVRAGCAFQAPQLGLCTCRLAAFLSPHTQGNKLHQVAARYGVAQESAHRAVVDARVCGGLLARMVTQGKLPADDEAMRMMMSRADAAWKSRPRRRVAC